MIKEKKKLINKSEENTDDKERVCTAKQFNSSWKCYHGNAVLFFCVKFYVESSTEYDNRDGRDVFDNNA